MWKRKPKIFGYRITETKKNTEHSTHRGVLQWRLKLSCSTPFLMSKFGGFWQMTHWLTVSWRAVLRAWIFVYPIPVSSTFSLPLHRLYTHCLWRSFALLSGSGCRWFPVSGCSSWQQWLLECRVFRWFGIPFRCSWLKKTGSLFMVCCGRGQSKRVWTGTVMAAWLRSGL